MYRANELQQPFSGLVGFLHPSDPSYRPLDKSLTESQSGLFVQTIHALCTIENLSNVAPDPARFEYQEWNNIFSYPFGSIVKIDNITYRAKANIEPSNNRPDEHPEQWEEVDLFSAWLLTLYNGAVRELFSDLIRHKKLEHSNRQLLDSLKLFDGVGAYTDRIIKRSRFVGLSISMNNQEGLQVLIDNVGLQVDEAQTLDLYLYHSSAHEPLEIFPVNLSKALTFQWVPINAALAKHNDLHDSDGYFILGYYEDDLTGQAIKKEYQWSTGPCIGCSDWNYQSYKKWSKHLQVRGISFTPDSLNAERTLPDLRRVTWETNTNWGINLSITVSCDLTKFFITNRLYLADALAYGICVKILNQIAYTTRINAIADKTRALALQDLSLEDKDSFYNKYLSEVKAVSLDFAGMSSDCMPCVKKGGITMGAV